MMHQIRDMEAHLRNTWQFDAWGFTSEWDNYCTLSDIDGVFSPPYTAERGNKFLIVEMKHWDGQGVRPDANMNMFSGQMVMLKKFSAIENFTVVLGFGDTSTRTVHDFCIVNNSKTLPLVDDSKGRSFKEFLTDWWVYASTPIDYGAPKEVDRYALGYQAGVVHALTEAVEFFEHKELDIPRGLRDAVLSLVDGEKK